MKKGTKKSIGAVIAGFAAVTIFVLTSCNENKTETGSRETKSTDSLNLKNRQTSNTMKKLKYTIDIKASAEKVYNTMLGINNIKNYQHWTAEFNPTSTYEGTWEKGSKMRFIGIGEDGKRGGMLSEIEENIPNKFVSIHHYGLVQDDKEITTGAEVEKWAGGHENYSYEENKGITTVTIEVDVTEDFIDYYNTTCPKALEKLKEMCESK